MLFNDAGMFSGSCSLEYNIINNCSAYGMLFPGHTLTWAKPEYSLYRSSPALCYTWESETFWFYVRKHSFIPLKVLEHSPDEANQPTRCKVSTGDMAPSPLHQRWLTTAGFTPLWSPFICWRGSTPQSPHLRPACICSVCHILPLCGMHMHGGGALERAETSPVHSKTEDRKVAHV